MLYAIFSVTYLIIHVDGRGNEGFTRVHTTKSLHVFHIFIPLLGLYPLFERLFIKISQLYMLGKFIFFI